MEESFSKQTLKRMQPGDRRTSVDANLVLAARYNNPK